MAFYAAGQNGGDIQVSTQNMPIFADWHPECYGPWTTEFVNEFNVYDPSGLGLGVMALSVYSDINVTEDLKLQVAGMYFMNEEETIAANTEVDYDGITLNAAASYKLASNTTVTAHAYYLDASGDKNLDVELNDLALITGIQVKF